MRSWLIAAVIVVAILALLGWAMLDATPGLATRGQLFPGGRVVDVWQDGILVALDHEPLPTWVPAAEVPGVLAEGIDSLTDSIQAKGRATTRPR